MLNGATDAVNRVVSEHRWVVSVPSRSNRGFAGGANLGATRATGSRLLFLNDDALITEGWLDALMHVLDAHPGTAAVGSLIIDSSHRVLEFGSSFDGYSPKSLDRGRRFEELAHEGLRDVPYVSACSLLIRRDVFESIGGFDEAYYPAYFEDADLALRLWAAGYAVKATPSSVVVHAESSSTTTAQREITFARTHGIFQERWNGQLPELNDGATLLSVLPRREKPVIVIDDWAPHEAAGSGMARCRQMLETLTDHGHTILFHARLPRFDLDAQLSSRGVRPLSDPLALGDDLELRCVIASRPHNLPLGRAVADRHGVPLVYDAEARFAARLETELLLDLSTERRNAVNALLAATLAVERQAAETADVIITISQEEADWFSDHGASDVRIVDPFPELCEAGVAGFNARSGAVFIAGWLGGAESPNGDGLKWFATEVLPKVLLRDPTFRLKVTGASPPDEILSLASDHLEFIGEVHDLQSLLDRTLITVCPIRFGAGVKLKTVDSLARGVPVVSTERGAEGLDRRWRGGLVVSDDPDAFAEAVVGLTSVADVWDKTRRPLLKACREHRSNARTIWREVLAKVAGQVEDDCTVHRSSAVHLMRTRG